MEDGVVAPEASADPPRGHWSWDGLAELSQIEAKELNPHAPEVTSHFL